MTSAKHSRKAGFKLALRDGGFSVIELVIAATIVLILAAIAIPTLTNAIHTSKLRGAAGDFASLCQVDRIRAVHDGTYYSIQFAGSRVFVDLYGTGAYQSTGALGGDPSIWLPSEVTPVAASSAPNTANLQTQFLPSGGVPTNFWDGGPGSGHPVTFSSRGLPCGYQFVSTAAVCESASGPTAFWVFFRDTVTGDYQAVTVSPAGRVRKWYYGGTAWIGI